MPVVARYVANSYRVCSLTGIGVKCTCAQKVLNFFYPAEYVALVVGAKPSVMKYWAFCCSCWVKVVISLGGNLHWE